jgi:hypothetical protein
MAYKGSSPPGGGANTAEIEKIVRSVVSAMKQETKVEIVNLQLDGKKIGEMQVRLSRY